MNVIIIFYLKNDQLQYIAAPKIIALISIYRAISQYIDYRDRPNYSCLNLGRIKQYVLQTSYFFGTVTAHVVLSLRVAQWVETVSYKVQGHRFESRHSLLACHNFDYLFS